MKYIISDMYIEVDSIPLIVGKCLSDSPKSLKITETINLEDCEKRLGKDIMYGQVNDCVYHRAFKITGNEVSVSETDASKFLTDSVKKILNRELRFPIELSSNHTLINLNNFHIVYVNNERFIDAKELKSVLSEYESVYERKQENG